MIAVDTNVLLRYLLQDEPARETNIRFEDEPTVWRALHGYRIAESVKVGGKRRKVDFADALIVNKAGFVAQTTLTDQRIVFANRKDGRTDSSLK